MNNTNILPTSANAVVGVIDPDAYGASTVTTGWVSMADFSAVEAFVAVGDIVATGLVDAKIEQATDGAGAGAKDIVGKAITQLTQAGGDSNKQARINVMEDDLDVANDFTHVRLSVTLTTAGADLYAEVRGFYKAYGEASVGDLASVAEIV